MKVCLETVLNVSLNDKQWDWTEAMETWIIETQEIPTNPSVQKEWGEILMKKKIGRELTFVRDEDNARLKPIQTKESCAWLNALPCKNVGTLLDDNTLRICMGLRLGCDICQPFTCPCGERIDSKGLHPLCCQKSSGRFFRHSEVNNIIKRALATIDVPSILEPTGMAREDGKRPDGATIIPWSCGQVLIWDFTCVDTFAKSYVKQTRCTPGAAAEQASVRKINKYKNLTSTGMHFLPFATETMGTWCGKAKEWTRDVGKKLATKSGNYRAKDFLTQNISLAVQRGNAASILGALPSDKNMDEIFYL
uniref:Uncharacterized protein n=2 Tax=Cacopsylla melanoneura TaxID=428564 RepID=A0A8D8T3R7_9HEMI